MYEHARTAHVIDMTILGISFTHDGTLTVLRDGENVFSIGEERLTRIKSYLGFPFNSLRYVIEKGIVKPEEVDSVAIAAATFKKEWARSFALELTEDKKYYDFQNEKMPADFFISDTEWQNISTDEQCRAYVEKKIRALLDEAGISAPILFYDHHLSHAASAYYGGGRDTALAITLDGEGDLLSGTVSVCKEGKIERVHAIRDKHSIGWLYSALTVYFGFKIARHEGKITGLAAYGDPSEGWKILQKEIAVKNGTLRYPGHAWWRTFIRKIKMKLGLIPYTSQVWHSIIRSISHLSREDMAAAVQYALEERVTEFVSYWANKTGISHIVTAGGVFANVKLNQRVAMLPGVESFFVFPNIGDGGNAFGAAALAYYEQHPFNAEKAKTRDMYLGPEFSNEEIESALQQEGLVYTKAEDVAAEAAKLIADKKIVGWFQGRMEYGPRALGNRSVVAHPTDASINKWLNERMRRTEYMPFAPSCLYEAANEVFEIKKQTMKYPAEFMTITFSMRPEWAKRAPAVAHVDGTARPQLVRKEINPRYHALLSEYKRLTGLPLCINTSFNMHEEPIVCSPQDAIASLKIGMIDVLAIGDFIATSNT